MRKPLKIIICIFAVIIAVFCEAVAWQWDNITALRYSMTMSNEVVEENIEKNDKQLQDVLDKYQIKEHIFSQPELNSIVDDESGVEDATEALLQLEPEALPTTPLKPSENTVPAPSTPAPSTPKPKPAKPEAIDYTQKIRGQIAKMYVLKASYVSELERIVSGAKSEFLALPPAGRTDAKKQAIVVGRAGELTALEKECDQKVAAVVTELRRLLKADGQDGTTADLVESTYSNEKKLKKAYYIRKFNS